MTKLTEQTEEKIENFLVAYDIACAGYRVWVQAHEITEIVGWSSADTFWISQILVAMDEIVVFKVNERKVFYAHAGASSLPLDVLND